MDALLRHATTSSLTAHAHASLTPQPRLSTLSVLRPSFSFNSFIAKVRHQTASTTASGHKAVVCMSKSAASGYASALVDVGVAQNSLDALYSDVEKLGHYLEDSQFAEFIYSPIVKAEDKKAVLKELAAEGKFQPFTLNLLNLLVDKKRTLVLKEFVKEFEEMYYQTTDTEVAIVTSAVEIQKPQLSQIAQKVQSMSGSKNVKMKNVIDPSLIAGFIVRFGKDGSRLIDMSVKGQLAGITAQIDLAEKVAAY